MNKKKYLKTFNENTQYETQKESVMGIPHIVYLKNDKKIICHNGIFVLDKSKLNRIILK